MRKHAPRVKLYPLVARAVEEGVAYGIRHYFKHRSTEDPLNEDALAEHVEREVLNTLCEVLDFERE